MLTVDEQTRLAQIRACLEKHRALGMDVSSWESEFLLGILDQLGMRLREAQSGARS